MALSITFAIAALIGIIYGTAKKHKIMVTASVIMLIIIATIMVYFYKNPY